MPLQRGRSLWGLHQGPSVVPERWDQRPWRLQGCPLVDWAFGCTLGLRLSLWISNTADGACLSTVTIGGDPLMAFTVFDREVVSIALPYHIIGSTPAKQSHLGGPHDLRWTLHSQKKNLKVDWSKSVGTIIKVSFGIFPNSSPPRERLNLMSWS